MEQHPIEPVSWLRLERYHLGELSPDDALRVERALAVDPDARACLEQIRRPIALRPLPELPSRQARKSRTRVAWGPFLSLAAVLTGIALLVWVRVTPREVAPPSRSIRVKGGDIVLSLVREREGTVETAPATFADGDRFKALLTCPPAFDGSFDVAVFQDGVSSFPFETPLTLSCGNGVPLPGAFTLTGASPATVCVVWSREPAARQTIEHGGLDAVRDSAACVTLTRE
jgi:hypothetical protein